MALAHESGSFDYKVINKDIRKILDARSQLNNTVQMAMPFVKATTTIQSEEYLGAGSKGFTLGLHAIPEDVVYEDMYSDISTGGSVSPLIGYTYTDTGAVKRIYAKNPDTEIYKTAANILDKQSALVSYPNAEFIRIPPPGITNVTVGRNKNGLLAVAQLQISIPSLIQLESLHRTFLIPGVGMVLEWGQQFAPYVTNDQYLQIPDITQYMFPWQNRTELDTMLTRLAKREYGIMDILENYVYKTNGQYMWMFGRVATFDVKSNSDGSYTSTVKIVGPSEDSWAYSTRNTVVPSKPKNSPYFCGSDTNSVYGFFTNTVSGGKNLKTLLDKVIKGDIPELKPWQNHVIFYPQGNQVGGEPTEKSKTVTTDDRTFADNEDAYFMTWRFFVNVVINDEKHGIRSIFAGAINNADIVKSMGLLLSYGNGETRDPNVASLRKIDDPKECFVGANKYLRSIDPSTLVIVNEKAVELADKNVQYNIPVTEGELLDDNEFSQAFRKATDNFEVAAAEYTDINNPDRGFLSTGVWVNHKAVVQSMIEADTFLRGISNLLERMNIATGGYWQLTLDEVPGQPDINPQSFMVVDANFRDSSDNAVKKFINDVHIFNKYVRTSTDGTLVGSELIECNIDLSLPKRLFAQIATLGLLSKSDIEKIGIQELKAGETITSGSEDFSTKLSDPNNTLAEMFGIISLSVKDGKSPDLTILSNEPNASNGTCGKTNVQLVAGTGGQGYQVADVNLSEALNTIPTEQKAVFEKSNTAINSDICKKCEPCLQAAAAQEQKEIQPINLPDPYQITTESGDTFKYLEFTSSSINDVVSEQLLTEIDSVLKELNFRARVSSAHRSPTYTAQAQKSRHISGMALDLDAVYIDGTLYRVQGYTTDSYTGEGLIAANAFDRLAEKLRSMGYATSEGTNRKAFLWRVSDHYDHIHISRKSVAPETPPTPVNTNPFGFPALTIGSVTPTGSAAATQASQKLCTPAQYAAIGGTEDQGRKECERCDRHKQVVISITNSTQASVDTAVRKFAGFRKAFRYLEVFPELMIASIAADANGRRSNAFGASPGSLSISGDIVMPGINGLRVGELFWIDRVPAFYKVFGAFQVMSIEDMIGTDGWKTKINARFNYLGRTWKESMVKILT